MSSKHFGQTVVLMLSGVYDNKKRGGYVLNRRYAIDPSEYEFENRAFDRNLLIEI